MKKFFFIVFCAAFIVSGCERQPSSPANPYSGTKWSKSYSSSGIFDAYQRVLSFTDNEYNYYIADINGNFDYMKDAGTYTYNGSTITFSSNNQIHSTSGINDRLRRATVSGNMITVSYQSIYTNGGTYDYTIDLMKN